MVAGLVSLAVGSFFVVSGIASAQSLVGATAVIRFWPSYHQVTLTLPSPACPTTNPSCEWLLEVNEPDVPAQTVLGTATGNSGILTVTYDPAFCGVIQADALIGPSPWYLKFGHQMTVGGPACAPPTTPTAPPTLPPAVVATTQLPFTATTSTPTTAAAAPAAVAATSAPVDPSTTVAAQLPFTGVNVKPLALAGAALILTGLYILTTIEQRRRALARVGYTVRTNPVGAQASRATRWFLGE